MPNLHFTQRVVDKLKAPCPSGKTTVYWDDETRGFGVACSGKTRQRVYIAQRDVGGKTRRITLGTVSGVTLDIARQRAEEALDGLRRGVDPKKREKQYTLRAALNEFLGPRGTHLTLAAASVSLYWQLERWLAAWLDRPLSEVTFELVDRKHKELAREIGKVTANTAMRVFRIVWNYAADRSALPECPVSRLKWFKEQRRTRHVTAGQLPAFYKAVQALDAVARDFVLLLLFTGMRRHEAASLRWSNIDLASKMIHVPPEVTKAKRALDLPMSIPVYDMLVTRRQSNHSYVFPGRGRSYWTSYGRAFADLEKATGLKLSAHDMRRTFASVANNSGANWIALKTMLNHSTRGDVTAGYTLLSDAVLRREVQLVADALLAACDQQQQATSNVARLR